MSIRRVLLWGGTLFLVLAVVFALPAIRKWQRSRWLEQRMNSDPEFRKAMQNRAAEEAKLRRELEKVKPQLAEAYARIMGKTAPDYVLAAVLSRNCRLEDFEKPLVRMVILRGPKEDGLDMDDYGFQLPVPGKGPTPRDLECCRGEVFWVLKDGSIDFSDAKARGAVLAADWYVESGHPEVIFEFGGITCLKLRLDEETR